MVKVSLPPMKPSYVLGFLLFAVWFGFFILYSYENKFFGNIDNNGLDKSQWLVIFGVAVAATGWITTSYITLRNSIKQHTINTLLQSRLSATYMENVKLANKRYFTMEGIFPVSREEIEKKDPESQLPALGYVLNYLEFVAVGIRNGDLDEKVMKQTFRGMVCSMREVGDAYVDFARESIRLENRKDAPCVSSKFQPENAIFEHLDWLYERWYDPKLRRPHLNPKNRPVPVPVQAPQEGADVDRKTI